MSFSHLAASTPEQNKRPKYHRFQTLGFPFLWIWQYHLSHHKFKLSFFTAILEICSFSSRELCFFRTLIAYTYATSAYEASTLLCGGNLYAPWWNCRQFTGKQPHQSLQLSNSSFLHSAHNHQVATSPEIPVLSSTAWGLVLADLRPTWN